MGRHTGFSIALGFLLAGIAAFTNVAPSRGKTSSLESAAPAAIQSVFLTWLVSRPQRQGFDSVQVVNPNLVNRNVVHPGLPNSCVSDFRPQAQRLTQTVVDAGAFFDDGSHRGPFDPKSCRAFEASAANRSEENWSDLRTIFVPADAVLVIGSLDITGKPHSIGLELASAGGDEISTTPAFDLRPIRTVSACINTTMIDSIGHSSKSDATVYWNQLKLQSISGDSHMPSDRETSAPSSIGHGMRCREPGDETNVPGRGESSVSEIPASDANRSVSTRTFLIPHFTEHSVVHEPSRTIIVAQSRRVAVYQDVGIVSQCLADLAQQLCRTLEESLLDEVSQTIGAIADLDGDNQLSIVLTDLDRRVAPAPMPVLGCVRDQDFQDPGSNDLSGDILYLDTRLPQDEQLTALLAHELTHAAILSMPHVQKHTLLVPRRVNGEESQTGHSAGANSIPPWMNEAVAHWVELHHCRSPIGFEERVCHFRDAPALCPIVADKEFVPHSTRRSGSRVSAAWFLRRFVHCSKHMKRMLGSAHDFPQSLANESPTKGHSNDFDDLFRIWSCEQSLQIMNGRAPVAQRRLRRQLPAEGALRRRLFGTAFECFGTGTEPAVVRIRSSAAAKIQTTVLVR